MEACTGYIRLPVGRTPRAAILRSRTLRRRSRIGNIIFRIPTPTFGMGLVEDTPDATLRANLAQSQRIKSAMGIGGVLNTSGNDGSVTRFGWKAQNKSLLIFSGEAYNVEQGVTNEAFPNERSDVAGCQLNPTPEDHFQVAVGGSSTGVGSEFASDLINFAIAMRLSAPPAPAPFTASAQNGANLFTNVGCALCHSTSLTTGNSPFTGMSNVTYHPYSDFAVHHMGSGLSDGVTQGGRTRSVPNCAAVGSGTTIVLPA